MRRVSRELSHKFGRQPTRLEMATEMGIDQKDLEDLISQSAPCASLDAHARGEEDRSTLGELIPIQTVKSLWKVWIELFKKSI